MKPWIGVLLFFLALIIGAGLAGASVWYWQNNIIEQISSEYIQKEATLNAKFEKQDSDLTNLQTQIATSQIALDEQETILKTLPLLFYTPGGSFKDTEKKELKEKVFDPYVAHHADEDQEVVAMDIQTYDGDDYLYSIDAYFVDGVHNGFLWGEKGDTLTWWYPECMGKCKFSKKFKDDFPDVVSHYNELLKQANEGT